MSQRALPKESQRYIPHKATIKNDRNGLHFMTVASLRLGTGKNNNNKRITGIVAINTHIILSFLIESVMSNLGTQKQLRTKS